MIARPEPRNDHEAQFLKSHGKIGAVLIAAVVATVAGLIVALSIGPDWRAYTVQGGSMQPVYDPNDLIITSATDAKNVRPGQIIVFVADWASEKYEHRVVHRVAAVGEIDGQPIAYTRGDANLIADPRPVDLQGDVRVVRFSLAAGGMWAQLLAGPFMAAVLATLGAGIMGAALSTSLPVVRASTRQFRRAFQTSPVAHVPDTRFPY